MSTRRDFLVTSAAAVTLLGSTSPGLRDRAIRAVRVGTPVTVSDNYGDTWITAWADDDNLYSPSNDTLGFGVPSFFTQKCAQLFQADFSVFEKGLSAEQKRQFRYTPIAFNRLTGDDPLNLRGTTVNHMTEFAIQDGYRRSFSGYLNDPSSVVKESMAGATTWKGTGCSFIDGALYWVIARDSLAAGKALRAPGLPGIRQTAANASIIVSTDYGKTWKRSAKENLDSPMFPGSHFASAYFVDYGRSNASVDGADRYVYAISNNGFWENGDSLILGRVLRSRLGALQGSDWEFYTGGDGMIEKNWTHDVTSAQPVFGNRGKLGQSGVVYLPARQRYMMIGWYYPAGSGFYSDGSKTSVWDFYESPKPWGPWTRIGSHTWSPQGYYSPCICPKFQSPNRIYVITAGDFQKWWEGFYRLTVVPIELS